MKKLFRTADRYIQTSDWRLFSVIKICILAAGVMAGILVKPKYKKPVFLSALGIFSVSYVPLMTRLFRMLKNED
ncbi:MAG: hypothetical protein IKE28_05485 [Solobacterium sp.]|nr:hypothetical protein [Solobacterium sp.]